MTMMVMVMMIMAMVMVTVATVTSSAVDATAELSGAPNWNWRFGFQWREQDISVDFNSPSSFVNWTIDPCEWSWKTQSFHFVAEYFHRIFSISQSIIMGVWALLLFWSVAIVVSSTPHYVLTSGLPSYATLSLVSSQDLLVKILCFWDLFDDFGLAQHAFVYQKCMAIFCCQNNLANSNVFIEGARLICCLLEYKNSLRIG